MDERTTPLKEHIRVAVARYLSSRTDALIEVLRRFVRHTYPEEVASIEFQVFPDDSGLARGWPVRAFFLDENNTEFFEYEGDEAKYPCCVDPGLLEDVPVVPPDVHASWHRLDPDVDADSLAGEALVPWFYDCWIKAGGSTFPLPASICLHDDPYAFDLVRGTWFHVASGAALDTDWPDR